MRREYQNVGQSRLIPLALRHLSDDGLSLAKLRQQISARPWPVLLRQLLGLSALVITTAVRADPLTTLNDLRVEGCGGEPPAESVLMPSELLNNVARELSTEGGLGDAIESTDYPAASSTAIYVKGATNDAAIREILQGEYCTAVINPQLNEVGTYRNGDEIWIVLAARMELPASEDAEAIAARVLELVNAARANSRQCGSREFEAAAPLSLSTVLNEVALLHAQDMAQRAVLDHLGSDGSRPSERVARAGYEWKAAGENIASGQSNADQVVSGWLDSPDHCTNIMSPDFTEMGVAFALASGNPATYWAQVFAAPR